MLKALRNFLALILLTFTLGPVAFAQATGPTTVTPYLNVIGDLTVGGTCTGCGSSGPGYYFAYKTGDTSRTSTTTLTADPHLVLTDVPDGRYLLVVNLKVTGVASSTGFDFIIGTDNTIGGTAMYIATAAAEAGSTTQSAGTIAPLDTEVPSTLPNAALTTYTQVMGMIRVDGESDLSINWAQNTSSANATTLDAGSFFYLLQML